MASRGSACPTRRARLRNSSSTGKGEPVDPPPHIAEVIDQATRYFAGEPIDFSAIGLDLGAIDPPRRAIYDALRKVEFGKTVTYGELAKRAGANAPQAAQEVGIAMARNPVPLIIPCHRVLAAGGKLGGFSARPKRRDQAAHAGARRRLHRPPAAIALTMDKFDPTAF